MVTDSASGAAIRCLSSRSSGPTPCARPPIEPSIHTTASCRNQLLRREPPSFNRRHPTRRHPEEEGRSFPPRAILADPSSRQPSSQSSPLTQPLCLWSHTLFPAPLRPTIAAHARPRRPRCSDIQTRFQPAASGGAYPAPLRRSPDELSRRLRDRRPRAVLRLGFQKTGTFSASRHTGIIIPPPTAFSPLRHLWVSPEPYSTTNGQTPIRPHAATVRIPSFAPFDVTTSLPSRRQKLSRYTHHRTYAHAQERQSHPYSGNLPSAIIVSTPPSHHQRHRYRLHQKP